MQVCLNPYPIAFCETKLWVEFPVFLFPVLPIYRNQTYRSPIGNSFVRFYISLF